MRWIIPGHAISTAVGWKRGTRTTWTLVGIYVGVDTVVIKYRNQNGGLVGEALRFDGPVVVEGHGTYLGDDADSGA